MPVALRSALFPAPLPLQDTLERTPAFMRTKTLRGRTTGFCERFVATGAVAARTEKILLGLPSQRLLQPQQGPSELCNAFSAGGTVRFAWLSRERFRGIFAALYSAATPLLSGDMFHCNTAARDAPVYRRDYTP